MTQVTGKVTNLSVKDGQWGPMTNYEVAAAGKAPEWYGAGSKNIPKDVGVGDYITFEEVLKGRYKNIAPGSIRKVAAPSDAPASAPAQAGSNPATAPGKAADYDRVDPKQETISKQAARNTAVEFMKVLASQEAIPYGKTADAKKKFEQLSAMLEKFTEDFYNFSTGKIKDVKTPATDGKVNEAENLSDLEEPEGNWGD
jgi:hypothetical protein